MSLKEQNILFFARTMHLGGTENVVLQLCEIFQPLVKKIIVCSCGGVNVERLNSMGIKHYELPDIEVKSPKNIFVTAWKIKRIVRSENITLIHTHHRMAAFYISILGLYKKCKFLNTSHNTFTDKKSLTFFAYRHANLIACGNVVKKNLVSQFGIADKQVTVIHNAVKPFDRNITENELIRSLHSNGHFVIGNIGRLSKQKGVEYYIQAIPNVIAEHPEVCFLIIGTGEAEQELKKMAKALNVEKYVFFMGYYADVQNIMTQLDLIVLSSLWEGLPLTPIETFSVSRTIVATAVDGTVEIVEDGKTGLLIEPQNSKQLAEKINWMIEHPVERVQMEQNALKRYRTEFTFTKFAEAYCQYYTEVCK